VVAGGLDEGFSVGGGEFGEADTRLARTVDGSDAPFGASSEAQNMADQTGFGKAVLGDSMVDGSSEVSAGGQVVARTGLAHK
jgi:hypothetical protein